MKIVYATLLAFLLDCHINAANTLQLNLIAGANAAVAIPIPIPQEIRKFNTISVTPMPLVGAELHIQLPDDKWSIYTQAALTAQKFQANAYVKSLYTEIDMGNSNYKGSFTGDNVTKLNSTYVTIPISVAYQLSNKVNVQLGIYANILISKQFKGAANNGYIRENNPTGQKTNVDNAKFDFSKYVKKVDPGIVAAANYQINQKVKIVAQLRLATNTVFEKNFHAVEFEMHHAGVTVAVAYKLKRW